MNYRNIHNPEKKSQKYSREIKINSFEKLYQVDKFNLYDYSSDIEHEIIIGSEFEGRNDYFRLEFDAQLPTHDHRNPPVICIDFGKTMHGFNGGFESLMFINGEQICAVDSYHNCIIIPEKYCDKNVKFKFELWTGFEGGGKPRKLTHRLNKCQIGFENKSAKRLSLLMEAINEIYELSSLDSELRIEYRKIIERFIYMYEDGCEYSNILKVIECETSKLEKKEKVELLMFGHAHIDLAWLWTLENGKEKTIRTLATVIKYCEEYDQFRFIHSTPQIFDYIEKNNIQLFKKIQALVAEGKIEIEGAMWVEADNNLPSGESLCKQILFGKKYIKEKFGYESKVLWLPDVFGYSWAMPQLLKKANVDTFMTTKISWNKFNKMPTETFMWKGIDGSEVFTHFMTTPEPNSTHWNKTYTAEITAQLLNQTWTTYEDQLINKKLPVAYGYGDGGGGPDREMIEKIDIFNKLPGVPRTKHTTLSKAAVIMRENIENKDLSTWDGELYLEYHRGTFTTQGLIKKYNKLIEGELRKVEQLVLFTNNLDQQKNIVSLWKEMLTYQFHDILPGSSLYEANQEVLVNYEILLKKIKKIKDNCLIKTDKLYVYNHHANHQKNMFATYYSNLRNIEFLIEGKVVGSFYDGEKHTLIIPNLKPLSQVEVVVRNCTLSCHSITYGKKISTKSFDLAINNLGNINYLYNKCTNRLETNEAINQLVIYNDYPLNFDAWDFDIDYRQTVHYPIFTGETKILRNDQSITILKQEYYYGNSTIEEIISIDHVTSLITFSHNVDWHESNKLLRSISSTNIRSNKYTSGIQYGYIERNNTSNTSWDIAKFEICAHNYIDLSQNDRGVSIIAENKYGFNCEENNVGISLLRSPKYPDCQADMGRHIYSYSLYFHKGAYNNSDVYELSYKIANKIDILNYSYENLSYNVLAGFKLENTSLEVSAINYSYNRNTAIVRLVEITGGEIQIEINGEKNGFREVTIDEEAMDVTLCDQSKKVIFAPFEVKTFEVMINE